MSRISSLDYFSLNVDDTVYDSGTRQNRRTPKHYRKEPLNEEKRIALIIEDIVRTTKPPFCAIQTAIREEARTLTRSEAKALAKSQKDWYMRQLKFATHFHHYLLGMVSMFARRAKS